MLRSRARGDQIFRRDIPRPQKNSPTVLASQKIGRLLARSRDEEDQKRLTLAHRLTLQALELARSLPTAQDTSLVDYLAIRERDLKRLLRYKERRLMRPWLALAHSAAC